MTSTGWRSSQKSLLSVARTIVVRMPLSQRDQRDHLPPHVEARRGEGRSRPLDPAVRGWGGSAGAGHRIGVAVALGRVGGRCSSGGPVGRHPFQLKGCGIKPGTLRRRRELDGGDEFLPGAPTCCCDLPDGYLRDSEQGRDAVPTVVVKATFDPPWLHRHSVRSSASILGLLIDHEHVRVCRTIGVAPRVEPAKASVSFRPARDRRRTRTAPPSTA